MIDNPLPVDRLLSEVKSFVPRQPGTYAVETPLPRLTIWSSTHPTPPAPSVFEPMFYAVLQGTKAFTIGGARFTVSAGECAATSFGLPYVGGLEDATSTAPYIAISLDLDVDLFTNVMLDMPNVDDRWVCSAAGGKLDGKVSDAFVRLVGLLSAPEDRPMLGRAYEAELYYRLLQSSMGDTLRQLSYSNGRRRQIKTAADWLVTNHDKGVIVADLASSIGMSLTSFHRHFKAITGYSPLAFQRQIRLLEARRRLAAGGVSVSRVAYSVGYVSPAQFSREYKNLFGIPPTADLVRPNSNAVA